MSLYDYYSSLGQALPSVQERAKIYESSGLGSASTYVGSAQQNTQLEAILRGGSTSGSTANAPAPSGGSSPSGYDINAIVNEMLKKGYNSREEAFAVASGDPERFYREYIGGSSGDSGSSLPGMNSLPSAPTINLEQKYNEMFESAGIADLQGKVDTLDAEISALEKEAADARARVGENPFLVESALVGRIAKIDKKLNEKLSVLEKDKSNLYGQIQSKKDEINNKLGLTVQQYNIDKASRQENMDRFNLLLSSGALANASANDVATLAQQTGLAPSFIQSAIAQSKVSEPHIITQTDDYGNVSIISVDKKTGNILNTVSAGRVGKDTSSSGGGGSSTVNVKTQFLSDADTIVGKSVDGTWVGQFPQLVFRYAPYMSLEEIYKLYLTTSLGKKYGTPSEDPADIKALYDAARGA